MKALRVNYKDGTFVRAVVENHDKNLAVFELSYKNAVMFLDRLRTLKGYKELICKREKEFRASHLPFRKNIPYLRLNIKKGADFCLKTGICSNIGVFIVPGNIQNMWAWHFNNFEQNCSLSYPIGGQLQYGEEQKTLTIWSNPKRWEYVDYLINDLEKIVELLK